MWVAPSADDFHLQEWVAGHRLGRLGAAQSR